MNRCVFLAITFALLFASSVLATTFAQTDVIGVKQGDWIQYKVTETGNPIPAYNITWASMNIINVQGEKITVNVLTEFANGTLYPENGITLNLATGAIGDGFFVPTNLNPGDTYSTEYEGIINITSVGQTEAGDAQRAVLVGVSTVSTYDWDRQTGIMISATSDLTGCVMHTTTSSTNIWAPQILGLNQTVFYGLIIGVVVVVLMFVAFFALLVRRKKKPSAASI
jgi:hypothetical protein